MYIFPITTQPPNPSLYPVLAIKEKKWENEKALIIFFEQNGCIVSGAAQAKLQRAVMLWLVASLYSIVDHSPDYVPDSRSLPNLLLLFELKLSDRDGLS